eukprot:1160187-Pelagomonas_calceolata.AAC.9
MTPRSLSGMRDQNFFLVKHVYQSTAFELDVWSNILKYPAKTCHASVCCPHAQLQLVLYTLLSSGWTSFVDKMGKDNSAQIHTERSTFVRTKGEWSYVASCSPNS